MGGQNEVVTTTTDDTQNTNSATSKLARRPSVVSGPTVTTTGPKPRRETGRTKTRGSAESRSPQGVLEMFADSTPIGGELILPTAPTAD